MGPPDLGALHGIAVVPDSVVVKQAEAPGQLPATPPLPAVTRALSSTLYMPPHLLLDVQSYVVKAPAGVPYAEVVDPAPARHVLPGRSL